MFAQRSLDSQRLAVSLPPTMQVTMHLESSGSARSDRRGRGETPYKRRGGLSAVLHSQGPVESRTGLAGFHRDTKSQSGTTYSS